MSVLKLVKFWDHDNSDLFLEEQYRYTSEGLKMYWYAVDAAIRFWNVALSKKFEKLGKKPKNGLGTNVRQHSNNSFKDSRTSFNPKREYTPQSWYKWYKNPVRRRFPTPP